MKIEYIEPTSESRRKGILLFFLAGALYLAIDLGWAPFMSHVNALPLCENIIWLRGIMMGVGVLVALLSALIIRRVLKLTQYNQTPLPNVPAIFRLRVYRDWRVKLDIASCVVIIVIFCGGYAWLMTTAPVKPYFKH